MSLMCTSLSQTLTCRLTYTPQNSGREPSVSHVSQESTTYEQCYSRPTLRRGVPTMGIYPRVPLFLTGFDRCSAVILHYSCSFCSETGHNPHVFLPFSQNCPKPHFLLFLPVSTVLRGLAQPWGYTGGESTILTVIHRYSSLNLSQPRE